MKVENIVNSKGNTVANQFIIKDTGKITFQSYKSEIATLKDNITDNALTTGWNILALKGEMWDYSSTTRKYFKQFINEETPFTYENKAQWLKEIENNNNIEVV